MVNYKEIAIADVLKHPKYGLVSFQPKFDDKIDDRIEFGILKEKDFLY